MTTDPSPSARQEKPPAPKGAASSLRARWRTAADTGFVAVPNVLLIHFQSLEATPTEFVVLLNLLMHLWSADGRSFPRVATIARRMDTSPRTVQRALNQLRALGLVKWRRVQVKNGKILENPGPGEGVRRRLYDLTPLVERADRLATERLQFLEDRGDGGRSNQIAA
jgi:hypothetical protein